MKLYVAPMNLFSNHIYRHLLLKHGADVAFTEVIMMDILEEEKAKGKLKVIPGDKTVFQIGTSKVEQIKEAATLFNPHEINLNMDCPHSTMVKEKICGGILTDVVLMKELCTAMVQECKNPSVKLRIGLSEDRIYIDKYLDVISSSGIKKVYIHARPLRYSYSRPAMQEIFIGLKDKFPKMEIVINGDIDHNIPEGYDGIMIGRAALFNPLIFEQIKAGVKSDGYDPIHNDPNMIKKDFGIHVGAKKKEAILEFLQIAIEYEGRLELVKRNLMYLFKGVTGSQDMLNKVNEAESLGELLLFLK
jgi:tRNA-dihydrouridine synthase B